MRSLIFAGIASGVWGEECPKELETALKDIAEEYRHFITNPLFSSQGVEEYARAVDLIASKYSDCDGTALIEMYRKLPDSWKSELDTNTHQIDMWNLIYGAVRHTVTSIEESQRLLSEVLPEIPQEIQAGNPEIVAELKRRAHATDRVQNAIESIEFIQPHFWQDKISQLKRARYLWEVDNVEHEVEVLRNELSADNERVIDAAIGKKLLKPFLNARKRIVEDSQGIDPGFAQAWKDRRTNIPRNLSEECRFAVERFVDQLEDVLTDPSLESASRTMAQIKLAWDHSFYSIRDNICPGSVEVESLLTQLRQYADYTAIHREKHTPILTPIQTPVARGVRLLNFMNRH